MNRLFLRGMQWVYKSMAAIFIIGIVEGGEVKKPNILFIFADDLTYKALGFMKELGEKEMIKTPALDSLRRQGCLFEKAFNAGSWTPAVCQASRTMLNTGLSVWSAQKYDRKKNGAPLWPEMMRKEGYETYFTGKWHVHTVSARDIFDYVGTERGGMPEQTQLCYQRKFDPLKEDEWQPDDRSQGGYWKGGTHWSEVVSQEACNFLKQAGTREKPFFMYVAFNAPHDPHQTDKKYLDQYEVSNILVPSSFLGEYPYCREIGAGPQLRDEKLAPFPRTEYSIQRVRREYYAMVTHLDEQIGRILETLKKEVKGPTYIVFTADQGISHGEHGLMGKQNLYDTSVRVPFIVVGPGVEAGSSVDEPIYLQSVVPSSLEWAGVEKKPEQIFFKGFNHYLRKKGEERASERNMIYGAYMNLQRMVRDDEWKMLVYPKANRVRLFNLKNDPAEMNDLAENKKYEDRINVLTKLLKEQQKMHQDTLDVSPAINAFCRKFFQQE